MQVPGLEYEQGDDENFFEYEDRIRLAEKYYKEQKALRKKIKKALREQEAKEVEEKRRTNGSMVGKTHPVTDNPPSKAKYASCSTRDCIYDERGGGRKTRRKLKKSLKTRRKH
jgi:hypothetical protein